MKTTETFIAKKKKKNKQRREYEARRESVRRGDGREKKGLIKQGVEILNGKEFLSFSYTHQRQILKKKDSYRYKTSV